jgi:hypothetical protein
LQHMKRIRAEAVLLVWLGKILQHGASPLVSDPVT